MADNGIRHGIYEDALALFNGTLFVALGIVLYTKVSLVTGSAAGIALLVQYATGLPFGAAFVLINLPFFWLAVRRMGWPFTLRTFAAIGLLSAMTRLAPEVIAIDRIDPLFAAIAGGALMGVGLLILFRHRAGLGGFSILGLYLQDNHGIRAGWFQLAVDLAILAAALFFIPWQSAALSVLGAVTLNLTLAINHRPGRYVGMS
ncbi:YitT family protein [Mesorhizobium sp. KR9-304]|uniref:YitT family protein n=1 Tax=Mesorhizobium sp. KR9-304 TaxID=3156614 RepID=UPI0032B50F85